MRLTRQSLANPAAVAIVTSVMMLLGLIAMTGMPAQLLPPVDKPVMTIVNAWPGASPREIESEVNIPVEDVLLGTPGMTRMNSFSASGFGFISLEFALETDMTRALIEVISRLNRLRPLPADAQRPQVTLGEWGDANDQLIEYYIEQLPDAPFTEAENARYLREVIVPELQGLYGVAQMDLWDSTGNEGEQLQIVVDPYKAADYGIDLAQLPALVGRSTNLSSGFVDVGRRRYSIRIEGRYAVDELQNRILDWRDGLPVRLGDIAVVEVAPPKQTQFIYHNNRKAFRLAVTKSTDANVLAALDGIKGRIAELNEGVFKARGLKADYSFDPALYINRSIGLLSGNLIVGMLLAIGTLWLFLRQWRATMLIALAIPVSLLATFIVLSAAGRSLNVISLAGLAFATGMVLDAAIVVLENIVRLREKGTEASEASEDGSGQVWGALLASTATTVAIFIPIMFLEDVEGQMFADLALTIAISVSISLLVAVTILPTSARYFMRTLPPQPKGDSQWKRLATRVISLTDTQTKRIGWTAGLMTVSVAVSLLLWPQMNYLPDVKRDTIDTFMSFPPGNNIETTDREVAQVIGDRLQPYLDQEKEPYIRDYYLWSFPGATGGWLAINPVDAADTPAITALMQQEIIAGLPDSFGFTFRRSLFGGFESATSVTMQVMGDDLEIMQGAITQAMAAIATELPGSSVDVDPDPGQETSELRFRPKDDRLAEVGWTREDLTRVITELGQGSWLGEYFDGADRLDVYVRTTVFDTPEAMAGLSVQTPRGGLVPLGELADFTLAPAPQWVVRENRSRMYNMVINPPEGMSLEALMSVIKEKVEPDLRANIPQEARIQYAGSIEDLDRAVGALGPNLFIALLLLILIMAGLFKSLLDAMLVVISIPLAGVGGVTALWLVNQVAFQPLDLLGMIGFTILLGLVVNNAILLVAQTRGAEARGIGRAAAVQEALELRLRPIFMSTLTSLFGMLPLLLVPGSGSEIYRGMAAVIVGGMSVSTLFTLILLPSLLQLTGAKAKDRQLSATGAQVPAE